MCMIHNRLKGIYVKRQIVASLLIHDYSKMVPNASKERLHKKTEVVDNKEVIDIEILP